MFNIKESIRTSLNCRGNARTSPCRIHAKSTYRRIQMEHKKYNLQWESINVFGQARINLGKVKNTFLIKHNSIIKLYKNPQVNWLNFCVLKQISQKIKDSLFCTGVNFPIFEYIHKMSTTTDSNILTLHKFVFNPILCFPPIFCQ